MSYIATFISALILALSHLIVSRLQFFEGPRAHLWRSMTGGAAVSFVFLSILPGLEKQQDILEVTAIVPFTAHHRVYLLCLAGFLVYYGFRRLATIPRFGMVGRNWSMLAGFSLYSALIGSLVGRQRGDLEFLFLATLGVSLHFMGTGYEFRRFDRIFFDRYMRWFMAASVLLGWYVGTVRLVGHVPIAAWKAFLSGAVIINTMWEEVPDERAGRFWPFAAGAIGFALLVIVADKIR